LFGIVFSVGCSGVVVVVVMLILLNLVYDRVVVSWLEVIVVDVVGLVMVVRSVFLIFWCVVVLSLLLMRDVVVLISVVDVFCCLCLSECSRVLLSLVWVVCSCLFIVR